MVLEFMIIVIDFSKYRMSELGIDLSEMLKTADISVRAVFLRQDYNGDFHTLLGLHNRHRKFMFPGGRIQPKDLNSQFVLEGALRRELEEEINLRMNNVYHNTEALVNMTTPPNKVLIYEWQTERSKKIDFGMVFSLPYGYELPFDIENLPQDSELVRAIWVPVKNPMVNMFHNTRGFIEHDIIRKICLNNIYPPSIFNMV